MSVPLPPSPFNKPSVSPLPLTEGEKYRLSLMRPESREKAERVCRRMMARGYDCPYIGSTRRTKKEQEYAQKRGTSSASQDLSWHLLDRAVDFRKRLPGDKPDMTTNDEKFFLALWECAQEADMRCLGYERDKHGFVTKKYINNGRLWDPGHCEDRGGYTTLLQATAEERPELIA